MLGYNSAEGYWDIPFPDYSFFGHEHSWLTGAGRGASRPCLRAVVLQ